MNEVIIILLGLALATTVYIIVLMRDQQKQSDKYIHKLEDDLYNNAINETVEKEIKNEYL